MKNMTSCLLAILVMAVAPVASARIINIPDDYPTIQEGINASTDGDTVLVAPGEYEENVEIQGKQITVTSSNGPYQTTILGHILITDFPDTTGCVFQGFTQIGQDRDPNAGRPGIKILSGNGLIIGNIVTNNIWQSIAGGILVWTNSAVISHNIIEDNWGVSEGGGIGVGLNTEVEISYNIIRNNASGYYMPWHGLGGGICFSAGRVFRNLIYSNRVAAASGPWGAGKGGGVLLWASEGFLSYFHNNTVVNNYARGSGGIEDGAGIYIQVWGSGIPVIENNIIAFNDSGGGLYFSPWSVGDSMVEQYNLFYGNLEFDIIAPETSMTDIFADPLFVDTSANDYNLLPGSPCIDAGNPDYPLDPDSTRVDIGALFFDQSTDIEDDNCPTGPYNFELSQNYPNPFNAQTTISFALVQPADVTLEVFNIVGQKVTVLADDLCQAGHHDIIWDGRDSGGKPVASGIYYYRLQAGDYSETNRMTLLK